MKYIIKNTSQFKKDLKTAVKRGYDIEKLKTAVKILADGQALPKEYKDHELKGKYAGFRDCHIEPDWILIYKYSDNTLILYLNRTGTHSDLFY
ncbi:MAG: type II toxin-antitoxin system YafQ family toxin [Clostridiales bacterium]|nr:type II toxin-antitoxin system YafQ family toxin [Clostridiales bacterium]